MLKIALGTTSDIKNTYFKEVLAELEIESEVLPQNTNSGVTSQPRTEKETKLGSINRAKAALVLAPEAEIGVGIEIGYEPINNIYFMHGWTSIADRAGNIYSEQSSTLELPKYFLDFLHDHDDDGVGSHVREYKARSADKTWIHFAEIIQYRKPFICEGARNAILRYLYRNEY